MTAPTPCLRHSARKWLAYCDDCTAWHLSRQIAARDGVARAAERTSAAPVLTVVPAARHRAVRALSTVA